METTAYARQVEKMMAFGYDLEQECGWRMDYIDNSTKYGSVFEKCLMSY